MQPISSKDAGLNMLPGPKGIPLAGNMLQIDLKKLHLDLEHWSDLYGPMYKIKLGDRPVVVVSETELINFILRNRPKTFRRFSKIASVLEEIGINGVFSAEGDAWKRQRRITMKALNTAHLRNFFPTLVQVTGRLKNRWQKVASAGTDIEVQKDLMRYTVDITTALAFAYDANTLEKEGDIIQRYLNQIFPMINHRVNFPIPYWHFFKLPADKALDNALIEIRKEMQVIISQGKARLKQNSELITAPSNFLEAILADNEQEDSNYSNSEIFGNILTLLLAGEDTTANMLAWVLYYMTEFPDVQEKMQQEVASVLGEQPMLTRIELIDQFQYIEAVVLETLRLKSVTPLLFMEANHAVDMNGIQLPAGTAIFLLMRQSSLQEREFTEAKQFKPERWLSTESQNIHHNPDASLPFGAGARFCPGRNLALLEAKTVLAMVCQGFYVSRNSNAPVPKERFAFAMMPEELLIKFSYRR